MSEVIKSKIETALAVFPKPEGNIVTRRYRESNTGSVLSEIYVWQIVKKMADEELTIAWNKAKAEGLVPSDDVMREMSEGQHIIVESNKFSCIAEIAKPRKTFNLEKFIATLVRKFRLNASELEGIAEQSKSEGTRPLSKKVLEV